jgi:curved DNA-binding protein
MAMKHHPDRGGDERKFKEISQAYEFLSDPQKKQIIDLGGDPGQQQSFRNQGSPFEFHFGTEDLNDLFGNFGFGSRGALRRNKTLSINVEISLEDVLNGKSINAEVGVPGGRKKMITIEIPGGIEHGQQIRYGGIGDNSIPDVRPGDLIVNVLISRHPSFRREGDSLIFEKSISAWDAMLGTNLDIITLDGKNLSITIPPGTQPETVLSCRGEGLPNVRSRQRGNLLVKVKVSIPKNLSIEQMKKIKVLKDGI